MFESNLYTFCLSTFNLNHVRPRKLLIGAVVTGVPKEKQNFCVSLYSAIVENIKKISLFIPHSTSKIPFFLESNNLSNKFCFIFVTTFVLFFEKQNKKIYKQNNQQLRESISEKHRNTNKLFSWFYLIVYRNISLLVFYMQNRKKTFRDFISFIKCLILFVLKIKREKDNEIKSVIIEN